MFFVLLLVLFQPAEADARGTYVRANDAYACIDAANKFEKKYQIQEHLLTTITNVETGRWNEARKHSLPWPWTVTTSSKGQYFETKVEAMREVERLQANGVKSIDVGCMQINLSYHGEAFENLEDAFDPEKNVEYGAKFLKRLYDTKGNNWFEASKFYHSSLPEKGEYYKKKILAMYERVKNSHNDLKADALTEKKPAEKKPQLVKAEVKKVEIIKKSLSQKAETAREWREAKLAEYRKTRLK